MSSRMAKELCGSHSWSCREGGCAAPIGKLTSSQPAGMFAKFRKREQ